MKTKFFFSLFFLAIAVNASSFCGFFVAKAGAKLYNKSSQVILVRDGEQTVVTMSNDFQGDVRDFAMVVPVPVVLKEQDIRVVEPGIFKRLDDHTAPRLAEYYDENPCMPVVAAEYLLNKEVMQRAVPMSVMEDAAVDLGVTIEAQYQIGEYDILILSAKESSGLKTWLNKNNYSIPAQAEEVLDPYIKNDLKFFVVKVNLEEQKNSGFEELRPIQIRYNSSKFMLPIRLGMANAKEMQDLTVYAFTKTGRVECTNYRTVKMPTDREVAEFVEPNFSKFYVDVFNKQYNYQQKRGVFLEYAWDLSASQPVKCDPCPTPPLAMMDLSQTGVDWLQGQNGWGGYSGNLFITRLHVRYDRANFPQDLRFQVTPNREKFQCRYVIRHPATGDFSCEAGEEYLEKVVDRRKKELEEVAILANWDISAYGNYVKPYEKQLKLHNASSETEKNEVLPILPALPPGPPAMLNYVFLLFGLVCLSGISFLLSDFGKAQLRKS